jgi:hypothetical protein
VSPQGWRQARRAALACATHSYGGHSAGPQQCQGHVALVRVIACEYDDVAFRHGSATHVAHILAAGPPLVRRVGGGPKGISFRGEPRAICMQDYAIVAVTPFAHPGGEGIPTAARQGAISVTRTYPALPPRLSVNRIQTNGPLIAPVITVSPGTT